MTTTFSGDEVAAAPWLELVPDWHHGYPQPDEDSFGYLSATYDLTEYCEMCGVGLREVAPFQVKGEPKWGRRGILQLNWVFDEFFVTPHFWSAVFEPLRVGCRRVVTPQGDELETVVQLVIESEADVATDGLEADTAAAAVGRGTCPWLGVRSPRWCHSRPARSSRPGSGSGAEHLLITRPRCSRGTAGA